VIRETRGSKGGAMGTGRTDGLRLPRAERRQQILTVAAAAFAESGFRGTSLADVAARVGVSQPGLLHHYPNKEALILAVLIQRDHADEEYLAEHFRGADPSVAEWLLAVCRRNLTQPDLVRLFTVTAAESIDPAHPAHSFYRKRFLRNRDAVARRIQADQRKGLLLASLDPTTTAAELLALINGVQLQWLMFPETDLCGLVGAHLERLAPHPREPAPEAPGA
jgi:AcrR family transcriptional regulator